MRSRTLVMLALLVMPAMSANAQIRGGRGRVGRQPRPAPLPPQAPGITTRQYRSSRFSLESYPALSMVRTNRYVMSDKPTSWTMFGGGTRLDFRVTRKFSLTGDITSAVMGAPFALYTGELGGRFHPLGTENRVRPFVDARGSWAYSYDRYSGSDETGPGAVILPAGASYTARTSGDGFGGLLGTGFDVAVSPTIALSTGLSLSRYNMAARVFTEQGVSRFDYHARDFRFTVGLRYNPRHLIRQ